MTWRILRRRNSPPVDLTGPATNYAHQCGALSAAAVREIQARHRAGQHWPTAVDRACDPWTGRNQQGGHR